MSSQDMSVSFYNWCGSRATQSSLVTYCSIKVWTKKIHCRCNLAVHLLAFSHCKSAENVHLFLFCPSSSWDLVRGYLCFQENWKQQLILSNLSQVMAVINRKALVRCCEMIWGFQRVNIVPFLSHFKCLSTPATTHLLT